MRPIVVRLPGAALAAMLGLVGTRSGAQAVPAANAAWVIAVIAIEQQMES